MVYSKTFFPGVEIDNSYGDILSEMLPNTGNELKMRREMAQMILEDPEALGSLPSRAQIFCHIIMGKRENFAAIRTLGGNPELGEGKARAYLHGLLKSETDPEVLSIIVDALYEFGSEDSLTPLFEFARNGAPQAVADASIGAIVGILSRANSMFRFEEKLPSAISTATSQGSKKNLELLRSAITQKKRGADSGDFMRWVNTKSGLSKFVQGRDNRMAARIAPLKRA
jgi:hypothetical protein